MAFRVLNLRSRASRTAAAAGCVAGIAIALFFAKWSLADGMSTHAADKDGAGLAVWLDRSDPQTHFAAAVIYEKTFDPQDLGRSLEEYKTAVLLSPHNYLAWLSLAEAEERFGDTQTASSAYARALELAPNYSAVQWSYGNFLTRLGRADEGFALIARAASTDASRMSNAVSIALALYDDDIAKTRELLGNSGTVNIALANVLMAAKKPVAAFEAWNAIDPNERRTKFEIEGRTLASQLIALKQFRMAAKVFADLAGSAPAAVPTGLVSNGGFEKIDPANTNIFDWQMSAGAGQQVGLSDERKVDGSFSLFMVFNTMKTSEFRQLSQTVPIEPGGTYSLNGSYRSELKGGVGWEVADAADGKLLGRFALTPVSGDWSPFRITFTEPANDDAVVIRLVRFGCIGEVCPISGKLWLDAISLERQ